MFSLPKRSPYSFPPPPQVRPEKFPCFPGIDCLLSGAVSASFDSFQLDFDVLTVGFPSPPLLFGRLPSSYLASQKPIAPPPFPPRPHRFLGCTPTDFERLLLCETPMFCLARSLSISQLRPTGNRLSPGPRNVYPDTSVTIFLSSTSLCSESFPCRSLVFSPPFDPDHSSLSLKQAEPVFFRRDPPFFPIVRQPGTVRSSVEGSLPPDRRVCNCRGLLIP